MTDAEKLARIKEFFLDSFISEDPYFLRNTLDWIGRMLEVTPEEIEAKKKEILLQREEVEKLSLKLKDLFPESRP